MKERKEIISLLDTAKNLENNKEINKAIINYNKVLKIEPNNLQALNGLARLYEIKNNYQKSLIYLRKIVKTNKKNKIAKAKLARTMMLSGDIKSSLNIYNTLIEHKWRKDQFPAWVFEAWGDALTKNEQIHEAITVYQKAIELRQDKADLYLKLAISYQKLGKTEDFAVVCQKAIELNPQIVNSIPEEYKTIFSNYKVPEYPKYKLVLVAIFKNESPYILEWIAYYRTLKVDHFFIYNNDSTDLTPQILEALDKEGIITYTNWPTIPNRDNQVCAYRDAWLKLKLREQSKWISFIDGDEFIVPKKHNNLIDFLADYEDVEEILMNWKFFGSSGQIEKIPGLVMERFLKSSFSDYRGNKNVKSISQINSIKRIGIHTCELFEHSTCIYSDKTPCPITQANKGNYINHDMVQVNHYFTKSKSEWINKKTRGKADFELNDPQRIRDDKFFEFHDRNDTVDLEIIRFLDRVKLEIEYLKKLTNKYIKCFDS